MKILVITSLYPPQHLGGYELRCRQMVRALRARGHVVEVLTSDHQHDPAASEEAPPPERSLRLNLAPGYPPVNIWRLRQIEFHNHRRLEAALDRFQPELVFVWSLGGLSKSLIFSLARRGGPVVYDVSDHWLARTHRSAVWLNWWNRPSNALRTNLLRTAWTLTGRRARWDRLVPTNPLRHARFPRLYFCSAALREFTVRAGFDVGHGAVIHCPVDVRRFYGEPHPPDHRVRRWLYVGRLVADKGVLTVLHALREFQGRFPGELTICGRGEPDYEEQLHRFVRNHGLPVKFTQATPDAMPEIYRQHDALIFPSEWEEPFALTPLEAMAAGRPVIGTLTGGSKELLHHGENALTYPAGDAEELAIRIRELAANPALAHRLAVAAQAGMARFDEPVIVDQIEQYLLETVKTWHPEPPPPYYAP